MRPPPPAHNATPATARPRRSRCAAKAGDPDGDHGRTTAAAKIEQEEGRKGERTLEETLQMTGSESKRLTAADVLKRYVEDRLPEFLEMTLEYVNQRGNFGNYPISVAAVRGDLEELTALLNGGADVNASGERANTPLHEAVYQNHIDAVEMLLSRGAATHLTNEDGKTALDIARILGYDELASVLERHT
jgi:hypothetical protein